METESSSPEVNDIENIGSQNPSRIFIPGEDPKKSTHKLVIKQQQRNFGSDDYECGIHDLYLFSGENALRLNRGAPSSVLVDTQEDSNTIIPAIISYERSQGPFEINENQFLYIDLDSDSNLLTIKDFREVVAPSQVSSQSGVTDAADLHEDADDQDSHRVVVEIARKNSPSCYKELPLRQLRILQPGSRVRLSSKSTSPLLLEYIFNRVPRPEAAEDPSLRNSLNPLTQPQEDTGCLETQIYIGSPPRSRADEINAGLLTQPQEDDDMAQGKESLVEGEQNAYKTLPGNALQGDHLTHFGDADDSSSEVTEGMTQPDGLLPVQHTLSTDHPTNPPISEEEERKDPSMESSPPKTINGGRDIKGDQNSTLPSLCKGDDGIVVNAEKLPCDTPSNAKESSEDDMIISPSERACIEGEEPESLLGIGYLSPTQAMTITSATRKDIDTALEKTPAKDCEGVGSFDCHKTFQSRVEESAAETVSKLQHSAAETFPKRCLDICSPAQSQGVSESLVQQTGMETLPPSTPMRLDNDGPEDDSSSITDVDSAFTSPENVDSSTKLSLPDIERARSPAKETNADHDSELTEIESPVVDSKVQTNEEAFHKQVIDDTKLSVDNGKVKEEKINDVGLQVEEEKDTALQGSKESSCVGTVGADPRLAMVEAQPGKGNQEGQGVVTIAASSEVVLTSNHQNHQECPVIDPSLTKISSPRDSNKLSSVSASPGLLNFGSEGSPPESVARHSRNRTKCKALAGEKAKKLMAADKIKVQETKNNKRKLDEIESGTPSATTAPRSTRSLRRRTDERDLPYRIMATQMENPTAAKKVSWMGHDTLCTTAALTRRLTSCSG